jgi:hypothetical protein
MLTRYAFDMLHEGILSVDDVSLTQRLKQLRTAKGTSRGTVFEDLLQEAMCCTVVHASTIYRNSFKR